MREVYFDNASTALPVYRLKLEDYGNPSAIHSLGVRADTVLTESRRLFSKILNTAPNEIIFTSGGTESNNLAIIGYALAHRRNTTCFIALPWVHPSITHSIKHIAALNFGKEIYADSVEDVILNIKPTGTHFICLPQICHETGDIYDIEKMSFEIKKINPSSIIFVDGAQGFCKESIDIGNIDLYSFSSHKIHGPCGVGGLYIKKGIRLAPLAAGGNQEMGLRSGTPNVQGISEFAASAEKLNNNKFESHKSVCAIKYELLKLTSDLNDVYVNSLLGHTSPYILNMSFCGIKGEVLVNGLSSEGIYASTGAACNVNKKGNASLINMGISKSRAESAVRFSFSHANTVDEAVYARKKICEIVTALRKFS